MKITVFSGAAVIVLVTLILFACAPPEEEPVTMSERMDSFEGDLNTDADRVNIYYNLHSNLHDAYKAPSTWGGTLAYNNKPFSFSIIELIDHGNGTGRVNAEFEWKLDKTDCAVNMKQDDEDNWFITQMTLGDYPTAGTNTEFFP